MDLFDATVLVVLDEVRDEALAEADVDVRFETGATNLVVDASSGSETVVGIAWRRFDERGVIRAFIGNLASPGRPQGGSTITQQVVKNLLSNALKFTERGSVR